MFIDRSSIQAFVVFCTTVNLVRVLIDSLGSANCIVPLGLFLWEIRVDFPRKAGCDGDALPNLQCMLGVLVFP